MKKGILTICMMLVMWCMFPGLQSTAAEVGNPKLMLTHYSIDNNNITPGEETMLHLEFTNMSKSYSVSEVLISYSSANNTIMPIVGDTNQFYIATMGREETVSVDIPIVIYNVGDGYAQATFQLLYTVADIVQESNSSYIVFPLESTGELSINNINVTKNVETYAKSLIGVSYTNIGEEDIFNAAMNVKGDFTSKEETVQIGNVKAGQNGYFEYYVSFEEAGTKNITISFTYEDADGKTYTLDDSTYSINVADSYSKIEPQIPSEEPANNTDNNTNNSQIQLSLPIILVIAAVGLIICAGIILIVAKRHKK